MIRFCVEIGLDEFRCCAHKKKEIYLVPMLGPITEQTGPVTKTPQYQCRHKFPSARMLVMFTMSATQKVDLTIAPQDKKGNPAPVQDVTWVTDNSEVLALTPSADGLTCTVAAVGPLTAAGTPARVTVSADADMGAGVVTIVGFLDVEITAGQATIIAINPGAPSEQE